MLFLFPGAGCIGKTEQMFGCPLFSNPSAPPSQDCEGRGGVLKGVFDVI